MPSLIFRLMLAWVCRSELLHGAPKLPWYIDFTAFHWGLIMQSALDDVGLISDSELVCRLEGLVKADRALSAKLLVHLGEVEARGLHLERGFSSMFDYCRSGLGMSEAEAHLRILAARVGRRFPLVLERLGACALNLTGIKLLAPHLTAENHVQLLDQVRGMSKRQIEVLVADLAPKPDAPARIRKLPERRGLFDASQAAIPAPSGRAGLSAESKHASMITGACGTLATAQTITSATGLTSRDPMPAVSWPLLAAGAHSDGARSRAARAADSSSDASFELESPRARATSTPLGLGRFKLQVTLGQEAHDALDKLVELFRHQNPSGDLNVIVERALFELLESKVKQRFGHGKASKPRAKREPAAATPNVEVTESADAQAKTKSKVPPPISRHIPLQVRNHVHARDIAQCTFVSVDGRRCTERGFIEVHHHNTTFARGGEATVENLRLACRAHNRFFAEQDYGRAFMHEKLREAKERRSKLQALVPDTVADVL